MKSTKFHYLAMMTKYIQNNGFDGQALDYQSSLEKTVTLTTI